MAAQYDMKLRATTVFSSTALGNVSSGQILDGLSEAHARHLLSITPRVVELVDDAPFREPRTRGKRAKVTVDVND